MRRAADPLLPGELEGSCTVKEKAHGPDNWPFISCGACDEKLIFLGFMDEAGMDVYFAISGSEYFTA